MKPEKNALRLLSATRAKAKMYEYRVPTEEHVKLPRRPEDLFSLAVGLLGDAAAAIASGREVDNPYTPSHDALRFAANFFDAYLDARLGHELTNEFSVLCACAYYLADNPGSASVIASKANTPNPKEDGELFCAVYSLLLGSKIASDPTGIYHSDIIDLTGQIDRFYNLDGDARILDAAQNIRHTAYDIATPRDILLSDLIVAICKKRVDNSARQVLPIASGLTLPLWSSSLKKGTFPRELWPAQRAICDAGVLLGRSAVVQMPTSAGKTKASEFIIRSAFLSRRTSLAIVVAPFRALCHDIRSDLVKAFEGEEVFLDEVTDRFEFDLDMESIVRSKTVLILTPEKLLYILRRDPGLAEKIGLIIYDEGHQFDSPSRGATYELLLSSLKLSLSVETQVVLISAVIANAKEIAEWLIRDEDAIVAGGHLAPTARSVAFTSWRDARGQLRYVSPVDPDDEVFFVPRVIEVLPLQLKPRERTQQVFPASEGPDVGLYMALRLGENGGVAVFCGRKDTASRLCLRAVEVFDRSENAFRAPSEYLGTVEAKKIASLFQAHLGEAAKLAEAAALGIFPHHSSIPNGLRLSIEYAMKHDMARVVICTSTLAQGVNLPIKYLLVTSTQQGLDRISVRDFHNLIGRAGRSGMHTEGSIIFTAPGIYDLRRDYRQSWRWRSAKELLNQSNSEPCASRILSVFEAFKFGSHQKEIWLDVEALAALTFDAGHVEDVLAEGYAQQMDDEALRAFRRFVRSRAGIIQKIAAYLVSHMAFEEGDDTQEVRVATLAINTLAYHLSKESVRQELVDLFLRIFLQIKLRASEEETRQAIRRSPLAPLAVIELRSWISENHTQLEQALTNGMLLRAIFDQILRATDDLALSSVKKGEVALDLAEKWVSGTNYETLHDTLSATDERIGRRKYKVDDVVSLCESGFGYAAAMTVATMADIAAPISENLSNGLTHLQRRLKYGLSSLSAIIFYEIGFADRVVASVLGQAFPNVRDRVTARAALSSDRLKVQSLLDVYPSYFDAVLIEVLS